MVVSSRALSLQISRAFVHCCDCDMSAASSDLHVFPHDQVAGRLG